MLKLTHKLTNFDSKCYQGSKNQECDLLVILIQDLNITKHVHYPRIIFLLIFSVFKLFLFAVFHTRIFDIVDYYIPVINHA